MKVYFVRHGESVLTERRHQTPDTPLSSLGHKQAKAIANRFNRIEIDLILTSPYIRTYQTAQEIEKVKHVPVIKSDLFIERKMPLSFLGKEVIDHEIYPILQTIRKHFYEPDWHYAEEENLTDLLIRAKAALNFILSQKKENIVVVTHGYFLVVVIYFILFGENSDITSFRLFRARASNTNTGLTLCEYKEDNWKLLTWNDYAHLGE